MAKILTIEDDESTQLILKTSLEPEHQITSCCSLKDARKTLESISFNSP
jgi:DNA-binding NtrC family response regulator